MPNSAISSSETFANRLLAAILALYKPPGAVYIASFKEPLHQSDSWKLFVQLKIQLQDLDGTIIFCEKAKSRTKHHMIVCSSTIHIYIYKTLTLNKIIVIIIRDQQNVVHIPIART